MYVFSSSVVLSYEKLNWTHSSICLSLQHRLHVLVTHSVLHTFHSIPNTSVPLSSSILPFYFIVHPVCSLDLHSPQQLHFRSFHYHSSSLSSSVSELFKIILHTKHLPNLFSSQFRSNLPHCIHLLQHFFFLILLLILCLLI